LNNTPKFSNTKFVEENTTYCGTLDL